MPQPDAASDSPIDRTLPQDAGGAPTLKVQFSPNDATLKQPEVEPELPQLPERSEVSPPPGGGGSGLFFPPTARQGTRPAPLKRPRQSQAAGLETFKQEFYPPADLHHHNIIVLYELFAADPPWFFTMELLAGA